ncbi:O-antigen ligase [Neorhizobium galegae]|uniref:O-antigen ligase family protein n=1 Tax=Neorhizobium galegae TaxID=399 RepID=UPI001AE819F4|nr:O-antigen ligase family protein [Neorhizobium galegae]MBP2547699.1 O-antigen ligase [Neorhizobium galegae]
MKQSLLFRRRVDLWLMGLACVLFPLYISGTVGILGLSGVSGLYVAFSRRDRLHDHVFSAYGFVLLYVFWALLLIALRHQLEAGNRQMGFMILLAGLTFIGPGLCLVRRPLRVLVLGTRIGTLAALPLTLAAVAYFRPQERYDGGGNAAIVALLLALGAICATIRLERPPRLLANGLHYLAIACISVFMTETRAVLVVLPLIFLAEMVFLSLHWRAPVRSGCYVAALLAVVLLALMPPVQAMLAERFGTVYSYYVHGAPEADMVSGDIRLTMWRSAVAVIAQHPFTGVGMMDMFAHLKRVAGENAGLIEGFKHVHNFILQELLANGVFGLMLLCCIPVAFLWTVMRQSAQNSMKRVAFYFFLTVMVFGLLHDPFYHELCMATTMLFLAAYMAQFRRWRMLTPAAPKIV